MIGEAIGHYRQAIALRPDLATAHDNLGNACLMKGQFDEAITHCTEAVRLDPDLPEAHADLGIALAIAVGDRVLMLENAAYSVISPESCSSILWRDWEHKEDAARILKLTADDLLRYKIIDEIVPEPPEGAHSDPEATAAAIRSALEKSFTELSALPWEQLQRRRNDRLRALGTFVNEG